VGSNAPPQRPPAWEERLASPLFHTFSPVLARRPQAAPPPQLHPAAEVVIPRTHAAGVLTATWYPAPGEARGAVLLLHPWVQWGRSYFHRGGRVEALRAAGYGALAMDLPGFGGSGEAAGLLDQDVAAGLDFLAQRSAGLPLHVWGVSSGGYWAHLVLSRRNGVGGAMFEDVSPHLLEWSWRMLPRKRPGYLLVRCLFPRFYRFLDLRGHAPALRVAKASYVGGSEDTGVRPEETRELSALAGAECLIVPRARHLGAIKVAPAAVAELALATFAQAEGGDRMSRL
jgi:pimeloyl-ACP methyl ester carboxylesterase